MRSRFLNFFQLAHLTHSKILSLSFSRNRLAYAVFACGRLDYYAGKTLRQYRSPRRRNRATSAILESLILQHRIDTVVMTSLNKQQRHSVPLRKIYRAVARHAIGGRLRLLALDPVNVRRRLTGAAKPTKKNVRVRLIEFFPELKRFDLTGTEWERRYYGHLFAAIACGLACVLTDNINEMKND